MRKFSQILFPPLSALLALACGRFAVDELRISPTNDGSIALLLGGVLLFGAAALAVWFRWRGRRVAAFLCGIVLVLYAVSVVLLGWEDVGGATVAIPLAAFTGFVGILGLVLTAGERTRA